jgi:hypothetical protein
MDLVNVLRVHRPLRFGGSLGGSFGALLDWFGQPAAYLAAPDAAAVLLRDAAPLWDADHLAAAAAVIGAAGGEGSADAQWGAVATPRPASASSEEAAAAATAVVLACNAAAAALSADPDGPQTAAEAARCAEEALNLLPHWTKAGYRLGYALHRLGKPGEAEAAVERAMLLSRLTKQVGRRLVRALTALGWPADEALVPRAFAARLRSAEFGGLVGQPLSQAEAEHIAAAVASTSTLGRCSAMGLVLLIERVRTVDGLGHAAQSLVPAAAAAVLADAALPAGCSRKEGWLAHMALKPDLVVDKDAWMQLAGAGAWAARDGSAGWAGVGPPPQYTGFKEAWGGVSNSNVDKFIEAERGAPQPGGLVAQAQAAIAKAAAASPECENRGYSTYQPSDSDGDDDGVLGLIDDDFDPDEQDEESD